MPSGILSGRSNRDTLVRLEMAGLYRGPLTGDAEAAPEAARD